MPIEQPGPGQLQPAPLDFEHQRADVRGEPEHLKIPLAQATRRIEARLQHALCRRDPDRAPRARSTRSPPPDSVRPLQRLPALAQLDRAHRHQPPHHLLERAAHQRDIALAIERARQRGEEIRQRLPSIALTRCDHGATVTKSECHVLRRRTLNEPGISQPAAAMSHRVLGRDLPVRPAKALSRVGTGYSAIALSTEPGTLLIERDRRPVPDRRRAQANDGAPKHPSPERGGSTMRGIDLQIHGGTREEPPRDFDECPARRDIDHGSRVAGPHARGNDPVLADCPCTAEGPTVGWMHRHSGFHVSSAGSNFRTRVRPVSPRTRMTYWASRRPRIYTLPDDDVPVAE